MDKRELAKKIRRIKLKMNPKDGGELQQLAKDVVSPLLENDEDMQALILWRIGGIRNVGPVTQAEIASAIGLLVLEHDLYTLDAPVVPLPVFVTHQTIEYDDELRQGIEEWLKGGNFGKRQF